MIDERRLDRAVRLVAGQWATFANFRKRADLLHEWWQRGRIGEQPMVEIALEYHSAHDTVASRTVAE